MVLFCFNITKQTSLLAAVKEEIDGNEEESSECNKRYLGNGPCDISSPILIKPQHLSKYEAIVNSALLASPKSV